MRITKGFTQLLEWKDLGGDPVQLSVTTHDTLRFGTPHLPQERQGLQGFDQQSCMFDLICSDHPLVDWTKPLGELGVRS